MVKALLPNCLYRIGCIHPPTSGLPFGPFSPTSVQRPLKYYLLLSSSRTHEGRLATLQAGLGRTLPGHLQGYWMQETHPKAATMLEVSIRLQLLEQVRRQLQSLGRPAIPTMGASDLSG